MSVKILRTVRLVVEMSSDRIAVRTPVSDELSNLNHFHFAVFH